jgi:hypothetical protein
LLDLIWSTIHLATSWHSSPTMGHGITGQTVFASCRYTTRYYAEMEFPVVTARG